MRNDFENSILIYGICHLITSYISYKSFLYLKKIYPKYELILDKESSCIFKSNNSTLITTMIKNNKNPKLLYLIQSCDIIQDKTIYDKCVDKKQQIIGIENIGLNFENSKLLRIIKRESIEKYIKFLSFSGLNSSINISSRYKFPNGLTHLTLHFNLKGLKTKKLKIIEDKYKLNDYQWWDHVPNLKYLNSNIIILTDPLLKNLKDKNIHLETLYLYNENYITDIGISQLIHLKEIYLKRCDNKVIHHTSNIRGHGFLDCKNLQLIKNSEYRYLKYLSSSSLKNLSIMNTSYTPICVDNDSLRHLNNLTCLDLSNYKRRNNNPSSNEIAIRLNLNIILPNLKILIDPYINHHANHAKSSKNDGDPDHDYCYYDNCKSLESLDYRGYYISNDIKIPRTLKFFKGIFLNYQPTHDYSSLFLQLKELEICCNNLGEENWYWAFILSNLTNLNKLKLINSYAPYAPTFCNNSLTKIYVRYERYEQKYENTCHDIHMKKLSFNLQKLIIQTFYHELTFNGSMKYLNNLEVLDLSGCIFAQIQDFDPQYFPKLRKLFISSAMYDKLSQINNIFNKHTIQSIIIIK